MIIQKPSIGIRSLLLSTFVALFACSNANPIKSSDSFNSASLAPPSGQPTKADYSKSVLLISMDAFRPDHINAKNTPNLFEISQTGVNATDGMNPSFPSLTFPNHYTLVTGQRPQRHGIVSNDIKDPNIAERFSLGRRDVMVDPRWWIGEPIWETAQKQGLKSGTVFWPGSEIEIHGVRPTYFLTYDMAKPRDQRVAQFFQWLDLPVETRPQFFTLYFEDVDTAGHKFGPASEEYAKACNDVDQAIGLVINGLKSRNLWNTFNVVVVSDHGMAPIVPEKRIMISDLLKEFQGLETIGSGSMMGVFSKDPDLQARVIKRFVEFSPYLKAYLKKDIPARFHYTESNRIPDIVVMADESAYMQMSASSHSSGGTHGYDNKLLSMRATFVAHGPAFKEPSNIGNFDNVDLYSMLCQILGIKPSPNDGNLDILGKILH